MKRRTPRRCQLCLQKRKTIRGFFRKIQVHTAGARLRGAGKDGRPQTGQYLAFPAEEGGAVAARGPKERVSLAGGCPLSAPGHPEGSSLPAGKRSFSEDGQETCWEGACPGGPCHPAGALLRTQARPQQPASGAAPSTARACVQVSISVEISQDCK